MKNKFFASMFALCAAAVLFMSCKKDAIIEQIETILMSEADVSEIIAAHLSGEPCGNLPAMTSTATQRAGAAMTLQNPCNFNRDSAFNCSNTVARTTYNYNVTTKSFITCQTLIPQSFTFIAAETGNVANTKLTHATNLRDTFVITGLQPAATNYTLNGTMSGTGTGEIKGLRENMTFSSVLTMNLTNLTVSKATKTITGGTGTFNITGKAGTKEYAFSGSLVFNGNGTATLTIGSRTFTINLLTGDVG